MSNCFDYLDWRGDIPFSVDGVNEVDGMILSRFSYAPLELIGEVGRGTIGGICEKLSKHPNLRENLVREDDEKLIDSLCISPRFSNLEYFFYENKTDTSLEFQFSAVTIRLSPVLYYVAFRGTDDSIVGWKEDLNMSFVFPVPAQIFAKEYLERVAARVRGKIIVGGHSKGGNLAVYAATFCKKRVQGRIIRVENFDGPGFDGRMLDREEYLSVHKRIRTYVPKSSVVGMLLSHEEEYIIVDSTYHGLLQHDTYSWVVERDRFKYLEEVTDSSRFLDATLKEWLGGISYEKREKVSDALYEVIMETKATSLRELSENWFANTITIAKTLHNLDDETKKLLRELMQALAVGAGKNIYKELQGKGVKK